MGQWLMKLWLGWDTPLCDASVFVCMSIEG
jgi:hypothetical protein